MLPMILSKYMGLASLLLKIEYGLDMLYINMAFCALRYLSIKFLIVSNGEYDLIAKEINDPNDGRLDRPEIQREAGQY